MKRFVLFLVMIALTSCYRMPDSSVFSTVPMTNNPNVVPQRGGGSFAPTVNY